MEVTQKYEKLGEELFDELTRALTKIKSLRGFISSYESVLILGDNDSRGTHEALARNLMLVQGKKALTPYINGLDASLRDYHGEDYLAEFVKDFGSPRTLVIATSTKENRTLERALHLCAEKLYPAVVITAGKSPGAARLQDFSFSSKVLEIALNTTSTEAMARWMIDFVCIQAALHMSDPWLL